MSHRALVTKLGLDGHDRGIRLLAHELRDQGVEVIYLGIGTTPAAAAVAAVDEDVDVVAVSLLSGAHVPLVSDLLDALEAHGADVPVVCGGLIPEGDHAALRAAGVAAVYSIGVSVVQAAEAIADLARADAAEART